MKTFLTNRVTIVALAVVFIVASCTKLEENWGSFVYQSLIRLQAERLHPPLCQAYIINLTN